MRKLLIALLVVLPGALHAEGETCALIAEFSAASISGGAITTVEFEGTPGGLIPSSRTPIPRHLKINIDLVDASDGVSSVALTFTGAETSGGTFRKVGGVSGSTETPLTLDWDPSSNGKFWIAELDWISPFGKITATPTGHGAGDTLAFDVYGCTGDAPVSLPSSFAGGAITVETTIADDIKLCFGDTTCDYWLIYNSAGTKFELWTTDSDGGGADSLVWSVLDGGLDVLHAAIITLTNNGLHLLDTNATHDLIVAAGSDLTADRILTFITGDTATAVTIEGTGSVIDQDLSADSSTAALDGLALTDDLDMSGNDIKDIGILAGDDDVSVYGDVGTRTVTVDNYVLCTLETVTITVNGSASVCTEADGGGANKWDAITSNTISATNLATCIDAISGISASAAAAVVTITHPLLTTYSITMAESEATCTTLASGADGVVDINRLTMSGALIGVTGVFTGAVDIQGNVSDSTKALCVGSDACDAAGSAGTTTFSTAVLFDEAVRVDGALTLFVSDLILSSNTNQLIIGGVNLAAFTIKPNTVLDQTILGLGSDTGSALILANTNTLSQDYDHVPQTNPTFYFHSTTAPDSDNAQYGHATHDQTAFLLTSKTGPVTLRGELGTKSTQIQTAANCGTDTIEATVTTSSGDTLVTCLEGTDWTKVDGDNDASATSLASCFDAGAGIGAAAVTDTVTLTYLDTTLEVVLTTDDVTCATVNNGADSGVAVHGPTTINGDLTVTGTISGAGQEGAMGVTLGAEETIDITDIDHVVTTYVTGATTDVGITFTANDTGPCSNMTTASGGAAVNCADTGHGMITGAVVNFTNVTPETTYNGIWAITRIDDDNFTIPVAFTSNDTGDWKRGDRFVVDAGGAGNYEILWHATTSIASGNNKIMLARLYVNEVAQDANFCIVERNHSTTDLGSIGFECTVSLADADEVFVTIQNTVDSVNMTLKHSGFNMHRE